ncbi:unnamed protein product [Alopecurus aequalis]
METLRDMALPPGFGFHPKDTELVSHYLKKKVLGQKIEYDIIPEVDIYKHEPWDLPAKCNVPTEDNKWHFFAARDRKYPNGARSNRATVAGYWKSTGKDRSIKDAFVLCKVTKRIDWTSENGNQVVNSNPRPQRSNVAAISDVSVEQPDTGASTVIGAEQISDVATVAITANTATPDSDEGLQAWLEELIDPSFDPSFTTVVDSASAEPSLDEQNAESSNHGAMAPKVEPEYASPNQIGVDDTDYLLADDIHAMLYPGTDDFTSWHAEQGALFAEQTYFPGVDPFTLPNNFADGFQMEELQLPLENNEPSDNGVIVRRRDRETPAASTAPHKLRLQRELRMVTSSSESINQTIKFVDNNGHLDLITNVKHQRKLVRDVTSVKQSDAGKSSRNGNDQGFFRGVRSAFRGCSAVGLNILVSVCMVGVAAAILLHGRHRGDGISL